jgi:hypothetical protein
MALHDTVKCVDAHLHDLKRLLGTERQEYERKIDDARAEKYQDPYRDLTQMDHPCCNCGITISKGRPTVMTHVSLHVGNFYTSQFITWCDNCWQKNYERFTPKLRDLSEIK